MGLLHKIFGPEQDEPEELDSSQAVIVSFDLSDEFGLEDERKKVHELEDKLDEILQSSELGDVDGDEFGDDEVAIYIYGANAAKIYQAIEATLKASSFKPVRVTVRAGSADDPDAKEEKHTLT